MALPKSLVSQFVKTTTDNTKQKKETFVQGNIIQNDKGQYCVKLYDTLNNSDLYIPVKITTNININQPVTVMIKNHSATVIGNIADVANSESGGDILNNTASISVQSISTEYIDALWNKYFK